jgi:hypothetical protein
MVTPCPIFLVVEAPAVTATPVLNCVPVVAIAIPFTDEGVIAPNVKLIAGVVVGFVTVPETPLAAVTETLVTLPATPEKRGPEKPLTD